MSEGTALSSSTAGVATPTVERGDAVHDFDLYMGSWRVHHGRLKEQSWSPRGSSEPCTSIIICVVEPLPPELFLEGYPPGIQRAAERLRAVVKRAVPAAIERVRTGWRLIGYDVPVGKRARYFAFVAPEVEHVHLGFEYGIWMDDPDNMLRGAHLKLHKVRYVTYRPGDPIPEKDLIQFTRDAARLAAMSREERLARELDRD